MTTATQSTGDHKVRAVPEGYHTVTPWIIVNGAAKFIDFLKEAFEATEQEGSRVLNEDGKTIGHAEVHIGDSVVMVFDTRENWPETPCFMRLYVENGDLVYEQALKAGATSVTEMVTHMFGDRVGRVRDPFGNVWWIQTHVEDVDPKEMAQRIEAWKSGQKNQYAEAMRYTQESFDHEMGSRTKK
ncbi:MAG: VOC family protein [Chloroflexota bacterium]